LTSLGSQRTLVASNYSPAVMIVDLLQLQKYGVMMHIGNKKRGIVLSIIIIVIIIKNIYNIIITVWVLLHYIGKNYLLLHIMYIILCTYIYI